MLHVILEKGNTSHDEKGRFAVKASSGLKGFLSQMARLMDRMGSDQFNDAEFLANHGEIFKPTYATEAQRKMFDCEKKQCYTNSLKAVVGLDARYVEGYVSVHGIPIRHAWIEKDGKAIDMTIPDPERWEYFGVRIPEKVAMKVATSKQWTIGDGVLGTLRMFPKTQRDKLVAELKKGQK